MNRRALLSAAGCSVLTASATPVAWAQPSGRFAAAAAYSAEHGGAGFMVVRHGIVLAEFYTDGRAETRRPVGEGARIFASLLAATMADNGLVSLDEPVAMTLGEWGLHPVKSTITIRALLNGTSGLSFGRNRERTFAAAAMLEPEHAPGVRFIPDAASYVLFAEIARRRLVSRGRGDDPARYLTAQTLQTIGCVPIGWARTPDGAARFDDGVQVTLRGWAQAGELIRREGVWRAQQLADPDVLREALRGSFAEARAGMGFWLAAIARSREVPGVESDLWRARSPAPPTLAMAAGSDGQRLYISPTEGFVAVRQTRPGARAGDWSDADFLTLLYRDL
ncbi:MAG: beta-lactamase family protein [Hyphomonadaceae bacterium]|nr:beta-lactamase family protein [Hyphomonadaceae bacterium]